MSKLSRENTLLKMKGAGDGIKNLTKSSERIPVPSSRKFTATSVSRNSERVQMELKKVIDDMEAKGKLKKSKTMAEITPTKSNRKKAKRHDGLASAVLHATPRPPVDDHVKTPPSGRQQERRRRLELLVYHRLLLFVWRRSKMRQAMLSESLRRRQDQMSKLEKQVECLKKLTHSECSKRGEAMEDCQRMESLLQTVRTENESLLKEKASLRNDIDDLQAKLHNSMIDMENMKNELNTKGTYMRRLENECQKERIVILNIKNENLNLLEQVKARDAEVRAHDEVSKKLNQTMRDLENRLKQCEEDKKMQKSELDRINKKYQLKTKSYDCIRHELSRICSVKDEMTHKLYDLENKLEKMNWEYQIISKENEFLRNEKKRTCWWKNTKDFFAISWALIQNAAYVMLPAL